VGVWGQSTLEQLQAEDLDNISVDAIGEDLKELFRIRNAADFEIQRRLHRFDKGQGFTADGSLSAKAWLRWNCRITF
ncbi:MAG: hypothetical protein ACHQ7M_21275, partial [Chloroflexota bacterium]